jgi:hypothetical protein
VSTVLGLFGVALFIVGVLSLSAAVTYAVVRLTPSKEDKAAKQAAGS